jgi:hypothetical protein
MYAVAGWMVSGPGITAIIKNPLPLPEPELPWWTVSYPWVSRAEDSLWVLIKTSGEKRGSPSWKFEEYDWFRYREKMDKAINAWKKWKSEHDPDDQKVHDTAWKGLSQTMWDNIYTYEYGSDPVMDAYLADYGMSSDPSNPLSFWNPCYVIFHLFNFDN